MSRRTLLRQNVKYRRQLSGFGGYVGSRAAQRTPQRYVRRAVVIIGLGGGIWLLMKSRA
jgi:uncharacterized membrane protein YfcA